MDTKFFIGTSGWNYADWKEVFYPPKLPQRSWLEYYATQFNSVEINATFYRFFKDDIYLKWRDQVPKNFKYVLKAPRLITHLKKLKNCEETIQQFCHSANLLEEKLGLILLQLAPNTPYDPARLRNALLNFTEPKKIAVEFRHEQWMTAEVKDLLTELGCVFCAADSPQSKLVNWLTADTAYIRMHGRKQWYRYNYSNAELKEIAKFAQSLVKQGAKKIYIFFNNDYEAFGAFNAQYLQKVLGSGLTQAL